MAKYKFTSSFLILIILITFALLLFSNFRSVEDPTDSLIKIKEGFPQNYKIVTPIIPDQLYFCGEQVPLENFDVYERLEREFIVNTYWHSLTVLTIKRANRWFPVIEPILEKFNIPNDFKYLCVTESTLLNVTSPKNAVGFWQFLKSAAKQFGLEVNKEIDERYHVEKATEAACKYLLEAHNKFGSWTLAAASYNMGISGVAEQLARQKTNNYYNLVLGEETSRYIFRILATNIIMNKPSDYGFDIKENELYKPFDTYEVTIDSFISSWADFAKSFGLNYKTLKLYNPWLRENYLTNRKGKLYKIKIPIKGSITIIKE